MLAVEIINNAATEQEEDNDNGNSQLLAKQALRYLRIKAAKVSPSSLPIDQSFFLKK
jgi:hypothetical protein